MDDGNDIMASYDRWGKPNDFWFMVEKHGFPVMQFTGLKGKNGKEIYEGDILEHNGDRWVVKPIIPINRFYGSYGTPNGNDWMSMSDVDYEVIGNIYENPKLLK